MDWLLPIIGVLVIAAIAAAYNRLVKLRNRVREAWSDIDVQLKRRHDLIPSLVQIVRGYAKHEKDLLEDVARIRRASLQPATVREIGETEVHVSASLKTLLGLVEAYPDLKADRNFLSLQDDLVDVEDHLQYARRYYNGSVRDYNNRVESVPTNFVALLTGFEAEEYFEIERVIERSAPRIGMHGQHTDTE